MFARKQFSILSIFLILPAGFILFLLSSVKAIYAQDLPSANSPILFNLCWEYKTEISLDTYFASDNISKIILSKNKGIFETIETTSGKIIWSTETGFENIKKIILEENQVHILNKRDPNTINFASISLETGVILKNERLYPERNGFKTQSINYNSKKFLDDQESRIDENTILEIIKDDEKTEQFKINNNLTALEKIASTQLITGNSKGIIQLITTDITLSNKKVVWETKVGGEISSLTKMDNSIIATSFDNIVYVFSIKDGKEIWRKRLSGRISQKPLVDANLLLFTVVGENTVSILNRKDGAKISQIQPENNISLIKILFKVEKNYIFQTSEGLVSFSDSNCQK